MLIPFRRHRWLLIAAAVAVTAATLTVASRGAQSAPDRWWPGYGNGADNSRFFASRQIDKTNVSRLQVAWTYPYGDSASAPIVVRGVIYGRGRNGSLVAIDAASGKELWIRENMGGMTSRGFNYWEKPDGSDRRLIFAMDSMLQEVDARTGKSITSFGEGGVVDLRAGIDGRDPATIGAIQSNTPGEVFENLIILGSAPGEGYMSPPGDIRAYDVLTSRWVRPPTIFMAPTVLGQTSSALRSLRWMCARASVAGTSSSCITISGIWIRAQRRNLRRSATKAGVVMSLRWEARPAGSTSSIATAASPSGPSRSVLSPSPRCPASRAGRHSRFRPSLRRFPNTHSA
jgi:hypothetical protein